MCEELFGGGPRIESSSDPVESPEALLGIGTGIDVRSSDCLVIRRRHSLKKIAVMPDLEIGHVQTQERYFQKLNFRYFFKIIVFTRKNFYNN